MPQRNTPQFQQAEQAQPYLGEYSRLAEQFLKKRNVPIYSVGQGLAEAGSDIAEAYFLKKAAEKEQQKAVADNRALAQAFGIAGDTGLTKSSVAQMGGQGQSLGQQAFSPNANESDRYRAAINALAGNNPQMAVAGAPAIMQMAKAAEPPPRMQDVPLAGGAIGQRNPLTNELTVPFKPDGEPQANGEWAISAADGKPRFVSKKDLLGKPGEYLPVPTGMRVMSDGQGGFQITTGGMDPVEMTKPTQTKLEDTILTGRDALARMNSIESKFKPEYQQLGTRWSNTWANIKDKAGIPLDEPTRAQLEDFSGYRRETSANLNQTIKDITGATVSEQEAPRLMLEIPNAGSGLFDGDGPTEFQAKVKGTKDAIASSIARAEYARKNGLSKEQQFSIPLGTIPQMIEQKGNQYRDEMKKQNPQAPDGQINEMVKARLREEFGL